MADQSTVREIEKYVLGEVWTSDEIYTNLRYICDDLGSRFGGSESEHQAGEFLLGKMKEYGLQNAHLEEFPVYTWERGVCELTMLAPVERQFSAISMPFTGSGDVEGEMIDIGEGETADFERAGEAIARLSPRPTAVFAANDSMAIGALLAIRRAGLAVPDDVAVAGFDDIPVARFAHPPLSTVRHDIRSLGERAFARLLSGIESEGSSPAAREVFPFRLVLRESTGGEGARPKTGPPHAASGPKSRTTRSLARRRKAT